MFLFFTFCSCKNFRCTLVTVSSTVFVILYVEPNQLLISNMMYEKFLPILSVTTATTKQYLMYLILYLHDVHYRRQALNFFISHFEVQIPKNFPLICKNLKSNGEKLFQIFYPNCNQLTFGVHFVVKRVSIKLRAWIFSKCLAYIHYYYIRGE